MMQFITIYMRIKFTVRNFIQIQIPEINAFIKHQDQYVKLQHQIIN